MFKVTQSVRQKRRRLLSGHFLSWWFEKSSSFGLKQFQNRYSKVNIQLHSNKLYYIKTFSTQLFCRLQFPSIRIDLKKVSIETFFEGQKSITCWVYFWWHSKSLFKTTFDEFLVHLHRTLSCSRIRFVIRTCSNLTRVYSCTKTRWLSEKIGRFQTLLRESVKFSEFEKLFWSCDSAWK